MPYRIKKVSIQNFATVRDAEIEFPDYGMVLVRGINECAQGKLDSSGAGKTIAGEALSRTCFGVAGKYESYGHFSSDHAGNKETRVEVTGSVDGKPLSILSGYKHVDLSPTGEGLAYRLGDDEWIQRGHVADTRKEVSKILGVTRTAASWTIFVDGDKLNFAALAQEDFVSLILESLNQPPWADYAENARKYHTRVKNESAVHEDQLVGLKEALIEKKDALKDANDDLKQVRGGYDERVQKSKQRVKEIESELAESSAKEDEIVNKKKAINKKIKQQEDACAEAFKAFEQQRLELKAQLAEARKAQETLVVKKTEASSAVRQLRNELEEIEELPDTCPTCKQAWCHDHEKSKTDKLKSDLTEAEALLERRATKLQSNQDLRDDLTEKLDKVDQQVSAQNQRKTTDLSERHEELDRTLRTLLREREDLKEDLEEARLVDDKELTKAQYRVEEAGRAADDAQDRLDKTNAACAENRKRAAISAYLRQAFGPTGIPNMVLQDAIVPLNESSRLISSKMTGNGITVQYSTRKELVSGGSRAELVIKSDNRFGAKRLRGNSKGEAGMTNLIVSETVAEMSNVAARVAFRWYDEVLRNPDETMCRTFFAYVAEMAKRRKMLCFVVDHSPVASNYSDYVLVAHKNFKGITTYRWD